MQIPKIIHQVWEGKNNTPIPKILVSMAERWKQYHQTWEYKLWTGDQLHQFVEDNYPYVIDKYNNYQYDVQRWDVIRYLILHTYGGLYIDLDYDCLNSIDKLLENKLCCFGEEPLLHKQYFNIECYIGNAFMATIPNHPFFLKIIDDLLVNQFNVENKFLHVLNTTGPLMVTKLYNNYEHKNDVNIIPYELVAPLNKPEVQHLMQYGITTEMNAKLQNAYALHYFLGSWQTDI